MSDIKAVVYSALMMHRFIAIVIVFLISVVRTSSASSLLSAVYLRSEYLVDPIIVATLTPRFSWVLPTTVVDRGVVQSAFLLTVMSGNASGAVVWSSGKVLTSQQNQIAYSGPQLAPDTTYFWTVQWWDGAGIAAPNSAPASFGTAPGDDSAWFAASSQWIGCTGVGANSNQLRVDFSSQPPTVGVTLTRATLYISGLGWHIPFINGARLSRSVFEPAFTHLRLRVLYSAHDVSHLLDTSIGSNNTLAVFLGNGWPGQFEPWEGNVFGEPLWNGTVNTMDSESFLGSAGDSESLTQKELKMKRREGVGHGKSGYERRLRTWLSLQWSDGSASRIVSSAGSLGYINGDMSPQPVWQCGSGALLSDDIYAGVQYDARKETIGWTTPGFNFSTGVWGEAVRISEPGGAMSPAVSQPVQVTNELPPCALWESTPGVWVFDFCQNFAGVIRLTLPSPTQPGTVITIRHAEAVMHPPYGPKDGTLYYGNLRSAEATDTYITRGDDNGETWEPFFTWHGFRYISITGLTHTPTLTGGTVLGLHFHSDMPVVGALAFAPAANTLNQLQHAVVWTQASNILGNPSDCPQRDER